MHSGDLDRRACRRSARREFVDLHLEQLAHARRAPRRDGGVQLHGVPFDQLPLGFAGLMHAPAEGQHFDPRAVVAALRSARPLAHHRAADDRSRASGGCAGSTSTSMTAARSTQVGGYRAALAHLGRDFADLIGAHARPTLWDVACIHAAARANIIYVRERDGSFTTYRRRDNESKTTPARPSAVRCRRRTVASPQFPRPLRRPGSR